ncbi:glycosyltransferase family 4 protein [Kaarinaea lacus]
MKIGLYHGFNLTGSGSNEFTRYLAKTFLDQGHSVHVICREYHPEKIDYVGQLWQWRRDGSCETTIIDPQYENTCTLHQIPYGDFYPVYISGKKTSDTFKAFVDLTDEELDEFKRLNHRLLTEIFSKIDIDILHTNHLVMQPSLAIEPCKTHNIPFIIYPHGSAIEYTVKKDSRYQAEARKAIMACQGLVIGNNEVRDRICLLFPDLKDTILAKTEIVGVGVDTQLFTPDARKRRAGSVAALLNLESVKGSQGKSPYLVEALHIALAERNYQAIAGFDDSYVHNNVDTSLKEKLSTLDFSQPVLLFVGALTVGKGLQSLLCALPVIYKNYPDAQLLIIGAGSFREVLETLVYALVNDDQDLLSCLIENCFDKNRASETEYWQDVSNFLDDLKDRDEYYVLAQRLQKQVLFLGRFNHEQLSYLFPCADLAIFPSVIPEAYPLVLMESLANGVLPMVSYFSGFADAVDELEQYLGKDMVGHMKISMDIATRVESIAENVISLLGKLETTDFSGELSRIARENYDWTHRAKQMVAAYQRLLKDDI